LEREKKVAKMAEIHLLLDQEQLDAIAKRLKRAHGQMGAVVRMLEEGRTCEDIVTQMAAVGKAINTAAFTLIAANLKECIEDENQNSAAVTQKLQKLFLSLA
jgi:DNA-binding FrmR family transcriptional regulator